MNTQLLPSDLSINEALAKKLVLEQFGVKAQNCRLLGEGFDNTVYLFNSHLVFRFPRRKVAIRLIELELRLLPKLSGRLPVGIPNPSMVGVATADYPAPFYGHEMVAGRSGCGVDLSAEQFKQLAADLGGFLKALHSLEPVLLALDPLDLVPMFDRVDRPRMLEWLDERWQAVKDRFDLNIYGPKIHNIVGESNTYVSRLETPVLVHGDLYHRHLLFNRHGHLAGVIDWGDSGLSDRVVDLGVVFQFLPPEVRWDFFDAYGPVSEEELAYARFLGLYYAISLLWYGNDRQDQDLVTSSLRALPGI